MRKANGKQVKKLFGLSFKLPSNPCGNSSAHTKNTENSTLVPREIFTIIMVFGITIDMTMSSRQRQRQQTNNDLYDGRTRAYNGDNSNIESDDLHKAASCGSLAGARAAVNQNKELLWSKDPMENLPLHLAVKNGRKDVAFYLVEQYPQGSYTPNREKLSPLHLAVMKGYTDIVDFMFQKLKDDTCFDPKSMEGNPILHAAITTGLEMVQTVLNHKPDLMTTNYRDEGTPLSWASYKGDTNIVRYLYERRPKLLDVYNKDGSHAVHKACLGGHIDVLKLFYSKKPQSLLYPDGQGRTVLHLAAKESRNKLKDVASYLLTLRDIRGVLLGLDDENSHKALALANLYKNKELIKIIERPPA